MIRKTSSILSSLLLLLLVVVQLVSSESETKPMLCKGKTDDVSKCLFEGDYCSFKDDFNEDTLSGTPWHEYKGDMNSYFVVESGKPYIKDGVLHCPLQQQPGKVQSLATIVSTTRFLNFGSFEAKMKSAGHSGVASTFISISNVLDEIDFEFVPFGKPNQEREAQANWYYHGQADFSKGFGSGQASSNTFDNFHVYRVDWSPEAIVWSIDGVEFNRVTKAELGQNAYRFPATPSRISFGVWHAIDNQWAGDHNINWDTVGELSSKFDYIKIQGHECGGGKPGVDIPVSSGFQNGGGKGTSGNSTSNGGGSSSGNGGKNSNSKDEAGNAFNKGKGSSASTVSIFSFVAIVTTLFFTALF